MAPGSIPVGPCLLAATRLAAHGGELVVVGRTGIALLASDSGLALTAAFGVALEAAGTCKSRFINMCFVNCSKRLF